MGYCTTSDLVYATGTTTATATLQAIIDEASVEVDGYCKARGYLASSTSDQVKLACIRLSHAGLLLRYRTSGEKPASETMGSYAYSDNSDYMGPIKHLYDQAYKLLDQYIEIASTDSIVLPSPSTAVQHVRVVVGR